MKILAIDIGAGTQDILLYNSKENLENSIKLVLPSPSVQTVEKIKRIKNDLYIDGEIMGGGKIKREIVNLLNEGYNVAIEKIPAKTIRDDLSQVESLGVEIVENYSYKQNLKNSSTTNIKKNKSEITPKTNPKIDPKTNPKIDSKIDPKINQIDPKFLKYSKLSFKDLDLDELSKTISKYELNYFFDYLAVAVQDHGYSPEMGDRDFRIEKIKEKLKEPMAPEEFAYIYNIPEYFTRMKAIESNIKNYKNHEKNKNYKNYEKNKKNKDENNKTNENENRKNQINKKFKSIIMDSKFASIAGAIHDEKINNLNSFVVIDIGNGHTMAASIENGLIQGLFEHHTSNLDDKTGETITSLINKLVDGSLTHEEVHGNYGHGAHILNPISKLEKVVVTGPRRGIIKNTDFEYYNATPGGDVMMTGPVGLIKSIEYHFKK
ncbi:MAG: DUF1786 domain-containing protein [Methanobrevibacter sp.]|jgi:uncharacterized protein (DUF1786 family)|nr:DUF1786 domain-containing protein [Methanobrevibacter sp.]